VDRTGLAAGRGPDGSVRWWSTVAGAAATPLDLAAARPAASDSGGRGSAESCCGSGRPATVRAPAGRGGSAPGDKPSAGAYCRAAAAAAGLASTVTEPATVSGSAAESATVRGSAADHDPDHTAGHPHRVDRRAAARAGPAVHADPHHSAAAAPAAAAPLCGVAVRASHSFVVHLRW